MEGQYSFVQFLVGSIPELAALVKQASAQGATPDTFAAMLEATQWWRSNADTARQMIGLQNSDPATYQQRVSQATQHVTQLAAQMGVTLTDAQKSQYATADLYQGLDDATLRTQLGTAYSSTAPQTGDAATLQQQLQAMAADYGVPVTQGWVDGFVQSGLTTGQSMQETLAGARASLMNYASTTYPPLAGQIKAGQTVKDIAQPYIAAMSQVLEIPDGGISLSDPTIQKALQNSTITPPGKPSGPAGVGQSTPTSTAGAQSVAGGTAMTLYDFQNQLRADPRWQKTDNAKASAFGMAHQLGQQWGFAS